MSAIQKIETFKAGKWEKRYQYNSFEPTLINKSWEDPKINFMLRMYVMSHYLNIF